MFNLGKYFYKSKKQLNRKVNYVKKDVLGTQTRHKKDFTWKKKQQNPFKQQEVYFNTKKKLLLLSIIIVCVSTIAIWIFHPFFLVTQIHISGNDRISSEEIRITIHAAINKKILFFIPGTSYLFVDELEIKNILLEKYPLKSVEISKSFPRTVSAHVVEKISYIVLDDNETYSLVDLDGNHVETLRNIGDDEWKIEYETVETFVTSTDENDEIIMVPSSEKREVGRVHIPDVSSMQAKYGKYPLVHINKEIVSQDLIKKVSKQIVSWYEDLPTKIGGGVNYFDVENNGQLTLWLEQGFYVIAKTEKPVLYQLRIISEVLNQESNNINYIDIRFPDRAYWQ